MVSEGGWGFWELQVMVSKGVGVLGGTGDGEQGGGGLGGTGDGE